MSLLALWLFLVLYAREMASAAKGMAVDEQVMVNEIARMIDHSLLQPRLTDEELRQGCMLARQFNVASVCIKPYGVELAKESLLGSGVAVGSVVGFPHGSPTTKVKLFETEDLLRAGAVELDIVVNIGKVLSGSWEYVEEEIRAITELTHAGGGLVKVIFETSAIDDDHKRRLCEICTAARADFVKTSTGYGEGGATDADLTLMRAHSGPKVQVKAAGGVRTLDRLLEVKRLGVTRVGATATERILKEARERFGE